MVDTPMSPPPAKKGPTYNPSPVDVQDTNTQQSLETITNHFQGMGIDTYNPMAHYSDCVICWKSTMQIQNDAATDY